MRVLCISCLRNEGPFVLEWIAHLRQIGVTDFLLYSNDCDDGTDAMLDLLGDAGVRHQPLMPKPGESAQWLALKAAWAHPLRNSCDWALVIDVDEFPNLHVHDRLSDLIATLPGADAITLPWRLFGNAGQVRASEARVTETFTRAMEPDAVFPIATTFFKSLFRPAAFRKFGVHRPKHGPGIVPDWCDGSGETLPAAYAENDGRLSLYDLPAARNLVELNHYSVKSAESFLVKRSRGLPNRSDKSIDLGYWVERNFNTVEDRTILAVPSEAELARLRALPGMADLEAQARRWHREKFAALLKDPIEYNLFGQLLMVANSTPVSAKMAAKIYNLYHDVKPRT